MELSQTDEQLLEQLRTRLEIDHQVLVTLDTWQVDEVPRLRKLGRQAARQLRLKVITHASNVGDGRVNVWIVINEPDSEDAERLQQRGEALLAELWKKQGLT